MLVIADNLNVRNAAFMEAVKKKDKKTLQTMSKDLASKGADAIALQCSSDGAGDEDSLVLATETVQAAAGLPLVLDSRNVVALRKAAPLCKEPPIINYVSADETNADEFFAFARDTRSSLILRALKGSVPATLEAKLMIIEDLIERANAADIPNERLFADPSVVHIAKGMGQEHLLNAHEAIIILNEMVDPPVNTAVWLSNVTAGLPRGARSRVAASFLSYLAGAGLSAAFIDVMDPELMKTVYLIKTFRDEITFAPADVA